VEKIGFGKRQALAKAARIAAKEVKRAESKAEAEAATEAAAAAAFAAVAAAGSGKTPVDLADAEVLIYRVTPIDR